MQLRTITLGCCYFWLCAIGCQLGLKHSPGDVVKVKVDTEQIEHLDERDLQQAHKIFERAITALDDQDYNKAEELLEKVIIKAPHLSEPHNNLGLIYFRRRQFYQAAQEFQRAIELNPEFPDPYYNLGLVHETADQLPEAIMAYQQALDLSPQNPIYLGNYLRARLANHDHNSDLHDLLSQLVYLDSRPEWITWARDELNLWEPSIRYENILQHTVGELHSADQRKQNIEVPSPVNLESIDKPPSLVLPPVAP